MIEGKNMADNRFKVMAVGTFKESAVDCPVQLKKYQIIYDVVADKTYLRAVLESFSDKKIIGVFLNIDCADIFEQKFAEVEKAAVNVECDKKYSEFGKECPNIIPKGTKTVKAYISRVVFSDMTVWENRDLTFVAPVSDLKPYTAIKEKNQLEKELAKRNYNAKYLPVRYEKSWRCTCGHLNGNLNDVCSACRSRASILFNIFDDKNLEICKKEDTYNEARKFDTSKDYLQASKLYSTILDYKDSKVLFAKALGNSQEAIYTSALDTLKTAQKEENFDSAIKSLSSISEYKDAKTQIEKAKEQKNEFIYNQALQRVKKDDVGKNDFDKSISDMQRIPSYKDSSEKIKEIDAQKQAFLDKKEHARKMKKVRNISIVACVITAIVIAILIPYFVEPNLYTKETTYEEITIGDQSGYCLERYNENEDKVVIPSEYLGKPVLKIGERAFQGKSIKEITIPESVRKIGYNAFADCRSLNAVYYTDIEKWCQISFENSTANPLYYAHNLYLNGELLTDLTIPDSVAVDQYTFVGCNTLQNITADSVGASTIAKSCQSPSFNVIITNGNKIDADAFRDCKGLKNITLPADVKSIGYEAFRNCNSLENIYFNGDIAKWCVISGLGNLMSSKRNLHIDGKKVEGDLVIPDGVKSIANAAFAYCNGLTSITISNSVKSIGNYAFYECNGLTSVEITDGVTSIDDYAFRGCSGLMDITIPDSVTRIGEFVFYDCNNLTSMTLPFVGASKTASNGYDQVFGYIFGYETTYYSSDSVSGAIYQYYGNSKDYHYYIPSGIKSVTITGGEIPYHAFYNCSELTSITIPDGVTSIGGAAFYNCCGLTNITIPDSVASISNGVFSDCNGLTSITIPDSVASIDSSAFSGCSGLTSITIPDSVTSIGNYAFSGCSGLTSVTIGNSVTSIGEYAFVDCYRLVEVYNKSSLSITVGSASYGDVTYYAKNIYKSEGESKLSTDENGYVIYTEGTEKVLVAYTGTETDLVLPAYITKINQYAFYNCTGLTNIIIPDSATSIGAYAFRNCNGLMSVAIGNGVTSIGSDAFYACTGLTSVTIPNSVTSIGWYAFAYCFDLTTVNWDATACTEAGLYSCPIFQNCLNLTTVNIGNNVTTIPSYAFYDCSALTSITISDSVTSIGNNAFYNTAWYNNQPDGLVYAGKVAYKHKGTMQNNTSIVVKEGTLGIAGSAFENCSCLTSIIIPDSVTNIGDSALSNCTALAKLIGPNNIVSAIAKQCNSKAFEIVITCGTSIGDYAFSGCIGLTSITILDGVTSIGYAAFKNCNSLTSVTIGNSVTSIDFYAFSGCKNLTDLTIGSGIAKIGYYVFEDTAWYDSQPNGFIYVGKVLYKNKNAGPLQYTVKEGTLGIAAGAFYCNWVKSIVIPNSVEYIGSRAFYLNYVMKSVIIGNGVTYIDAEAFYGCSGLETMFYAGTKEQWKSIYIGSRNEEYLTDEKIYYYSEERPTTTGNYWHYDEDGVTPVIWD